MNAIRMAIDTFHVRLLYRKVWSVELDISCIGADKRKARDGLMWL